MPQSLVIPIIIFNHLCCAPNARHNYENINVKYFLPSQPLAKYAPRYSPPLLQNPTALPRNASCETPWRSCFSWRAWAAWRPCVCGGAAGAGPWRGRGGCGRMAALWCRLWVRFSVERARVPSVEWLKPLEAGIRTVTGGVLQCKAEFSQYC